MDPGIAAFAAIGCTMVGFYVGSWVKRKSYAIIPFNDPVSWMLIFALFAILLMPDINKSWAIINVYDLTHLACLVGFGITYLIGYVKEDMMCEFVCTHDLFKMTQKITPIVYYYNNRNELCWQPQKLTYVLKRMIFDVDNPLDFPLEAINRRRFIEFQGKFIKLGEYCVDTARMEIHEEIVQKGRLKFKVLNCVFDPSPMNTAGAWDFYVNGKMSSEIVNNYERLKIKDMNANADIAMARMKGAIEIVKGIADMKPETAVIGSILSDLDMRNTSEEDVRRANDVGQDVRGDVERFKMFRSRGGGGQND